MTKKHNRDLELIDELVATYKEVQGMENPGPEDWKRRNKALSSLLESFQDYFSKYAIIFHGGELNMRNRDTRSFLGMFLAEGEGFGDLAKARFRLTRVMKSFEQDEIYNELVLIFINLLDKYKIRRKAETGELINFVRYFTQVFRWRVKDWFNRLAKDPLMNAPSSLSDLDDVNEGSALNEFLTGRAMEISKEEMERMEDGLDVEGLDLAWVMQTKNRLFKELTIYQRQLLHMHFMLGLTMKEISERLGCDKDTVQRHLGLILDGLRSQIRKDGEGEEKEGRPGRFLRARQPA